MPPPTARGPVAPALGCFATARGPVALPGLEDEDGGAGLAEPETGPSSPAAASARELFLRSRPEVRADIA